jgi:hypothetical protein
MPKTASEFEKIITDISQFTVLKPNHINAPISKDSLYNLNELDKELLQKI